MTYRFESAHPTFSLPSRLMGDFGSIVRVLSRVMDGTRHLFSMRRTVASQLVSDESPRCLTLLLEQPTKEAGCRFRIASCLHQDIQDLAILVNCSIQIALLFVDPNEDFIQEPLITARTGMLAQPIGIDWAESNAPAPNGFIRYIDTTLGK
jgi:hypothetical protein